jgi:hypothetical protein
MVTKKVSKTKKGKPFDFEEHAKPLFSDEYLKEEAQEAIKAQEEYKRRMNPPRMVYWSNCKFCGRTMPDSDGNSSDPKNPTLIVCDECRMDECSFKLVNDFIAGIEYECYWDHHVQYRFNELIKKFGPKSSKKHVYLEFGHIGCHPDDEFRVGEIPYKRMCD